MRGLVLVIAALCGASALAQEIGGEVQPITPGNTAAQPQTNPVFSTAGHAAPSPRGKKAVEEPASGASAGKGLFGVRATLWPAALMGAPSLAGLGGLSALSAFSTVPAMGFSYWVDNELTFLFDLGLGAGLFNQNLYWSVGALLGIDYHFRKISDSIRPLINIQVGVHLPMNTVQGNDIVPHVSVVGQCGGGAEYFFGPNFAVYGKVLLGVGYGYDLAPGTGSLALNTTHAVGASWYF